MTEELRALITALTCPHCNGGGTLAWRVVQRSPLGLHATHNTTPCRTCEGDGLSPKGKQLYEQTNLCPH